MEDITSLVDESKDVDILCFDFKQAFDSIPPERLVVRLAIDKVCGNFLGWTKSVRLGRTCEGRICKIM